jgi:stage II sporulation protein D
MVSSVEASPVSEWEFQCRHDRVRAIRLGKSGAALDLPSPLGITTPAGFFQVRGRPYREELRIFAKGSLCEAVNVVDLEKYLQGIVNAEFSSRWNEEAIEAQVVAARSYAYAEIQKSKNAHYDVESSVKDQVYDGAFREDPRSARIVEKTRGLVLLVGNQIKPEPLRAFYHSTCAGRTQLPEQVWGKSHPGFKKSVPCPYCASSPSMNWDLRLSQDTILEKFRSHALAQGQRVHGRGLKKWPRDWEKRLRFGQLVNLKVDEVDSAGHVLSVVTEWRLPGYPQSAKLAVSGSKFREWMGSGNFKSASFEVTPQFSKTSAGWYFKGRGYGHGVGMCQYGAKAMGERGFRMASILRHYYPDAVLRKLW